MILHPKRRFVALVLPFLLVASAAKCTPQEVQQVIRETHGVEISLDQAIVTADAIDKIPPPPPAPVIPPVCWSNPDPDKAPQKHSLNCTMGYYIALGQGWSEHDFWCLDSVIMRESSWYNVPNAAGGRAYGIPQALPGSKMASFGADWHDNVITQLRWLILYYVVDGNHDSPCEAKAFKDRMGWY